MFKSKSKTQSITDTVNSSTLIGAGTVITGDLESNGDIRIDGTLKGNLIGKAKIIVGEKGVVEGNIEGLQADIMGQVIGNIKMQELLFLHGNTEVHGDIYTGKLQVEPTAVFNGKCHMVANIVELKKGLASAVNQ